MCMYMYVDYTCTCTFTVQYSTRPYTRLKHSSCIRSANVSRHILRVLHRRLSRAELGVLLNRTVYKPIVSTPMLGDNAKYSIQQILYIAFNQFDFLVTGERCFMVTSVKPCWVCWFDPIKHVIITQHDSPTKLDSVSMHY
jgi:hypothetical protein